LGRAINTVCHASNRLYCHRFFNKTPYELLIGRKPNISNFWVFGCKCYILRKDIRLSKFQGKCDEEFLLGYSSCRKAYRVYNKTKGIIEEAYDIEFDETNGSEDEEDNLEDVRDEGLANAMKTMSIGDIRPRQEEDEDVGPSYSLRGNPPSSTNNNDQDQPSNDIIQDNIPQDDSQLLSPSPPFSSTQEPSAQPRIHHNVAKDQLIDQIMGDISKGVQTRSRIASFCQHYSFVSSIEPNRIDEALQDPDWVNAMYEELNNFTRNKV
jgi:hypothetical protein